MTRRLAVVFSVVAVLAVAGVLVVTRSGNSDPTAPPPVTSADDGQVTSSQRANACLGGTADINDAVLYAHQHAPITPAGAAEFTATVLRWVLPNRTRTGGELAVAAQLGDSQFVERWRRHLQEGTDGWEAGDLDFSQGGWYVIETGAGGVPSSAYVLGLLRGSAGESLNTDIGLRLNLTVDGNGRWRAVSMDPTSAADITTLKPAGVPFQGQC